MSTLENGTASQSVVESIDIDGFAVGKGVLSESDCRAVEVNLDRSALSGAGSRNLLDSEWCAALATRIRMEPVLSQVLADNVAVQCTYFEKNTESNWLVAIHQDLSIPVKERVDSEHLAGWNTKQGRTFLQAPVLVLERMLAVRLAVDDNGPANGSLRVVPRSHRLGRTAGGDCIARRRELGEIECHVPRGGAVLMKPLLLHASSKATGSQTRRILHFVYGPKKLPFGLEWAHAI